MSQTQRTTSYIILFIAFILTVTAFIICLGISSFIFAKKIESGLEDEGTSNIWLGQRGDRGYMGPPGVQGPSGPSGTSSTSNFKYFYANLINESYSGQVFAPLITYGDYPGQPGIDDYTTNATNYYFLGKTCTVVGAAASNGESDQITINIYAGSDPYFAKGESFTFMSGISNYKGNDNQNIALKTPLNDDDGFAYNIYVSPGVIAPLSEDNLEYGIKYTYTLMGNYTDLKGNTYNNVVLRSVAYTGIVTEEGLSCNLPPVSS